jgi:predicted Zn-dependent peptidase
MSPFRDCGSMAVYSGCAPDKTREVLTLTLAEFTRMKAEPVSEDELKRAKDQIKSNMVLGLESSSSRMSNLARQQMYYGRFFSAEEIIAGVEAVTSADVQRLANELFVTEKLALTLLGNLGKLKIDRSELAC